MGQAWNSLEISVNLLCFVDGPDVSLHTDRYFDKAFGLLKQFPPVVGPPVRAEATSLFLRGNGPDRFVFANDYFTSLAQAFFELEFVRDALTFGDSDKKQ